MLYGNVAAAPGPLAEALSLFANGGAMGQEMLAVDWSRTPVGPVSSWPASLRTAVRILLQCRLPMYIAWGPQHTQFYNDAYRPILGAKHSGAIGASASATWAEIWDTIGPMWAEVWQGQSFGFDDFKLTIDRYGYPEDCYFNYSYSAVPDDEGAPAGILVTFTDTTSKVQAQRRQAFLFDVSQRLRQLADPDDIMYQASELLGTHLSAARAGYGELDASGEVVRVERDWTDGSVLSLKGKQRLLDGFGPQIAASLRTGQVLQIDDVMTDPRCAPFAPAYVDINVMASLNVPMVKEGRFYAILYVHRPCAHAWSEQEVALAQDVAELTWDAVMRARSQKEVQISEDHFRHTVELNPDVQWTATPDGLIDRIATRWEEWTGVPGYARGWMQAVHPDDLERVQTNWDACLASGEPFNIEARVRLRDGSFSWMQARAFPRRDTDGTILRWYGTTQNIAAYKQALAQVDKRDRDFRTLAETMPNQAWIADNTGRLYWFNRRVYEYSGHAEGELDGEAWASIVHPDDLPQTVAAWSGAVASAQPYENEFRLRNATTGEYHWFIARALPLLDADTSVMRWIGTNTDVHEQKTLADSLARMNERLEAEVARRTADRDRMWRLSTDIMLVAQFDSTVVAVNPAWHAMLGWAEDELLGTAFLGLVHPDDIQATLDEAGKLSRGVKTLHFENRYRHRDGSYRWLAWTAVPDDTFIHAVARDITREKEQREALEQAEMALRQAQKLESIGKLTGGVAHDFNNILQVVSGSMQLLQGHLTGNRAASERLASAMSAVERGAKLSSQLLAFARRQPLQPTVIQPARMIANMDDLLRRALGETIAVETSTSKGCWPTLVDQHQLENVLLNLAINARDAMPEGGRLTIEVGNATLDEHYVAVHQDIPAGHYVMFAVTDNGTGMTPEVLEHACEPFFTTKREGEGTGLGLSMAYGFVKQSGGHFRIYSEVGHGTSIKLYFPRSYAQEDKLPELPAQPVQGGDETILVVEDDPDVQATVIALLAELGYRVLKADDAQSALGILKSGMHIDMLFTDVVMPGTLRSPELARQAKLLHPRIEVLFTSGYTQNAIVHGGRLDPGVQLISKPYMREQLARKIRHMLGNQQQSQVALTAPPPDAARGGRRILVVEDILDAQLLLCDMLTALGHHARGTGSGAQALQALSEAQFDVLLTDYGLPDMTGVELANRLKATAPALRVVFLTGYGALLDDLPEYPHTLIAKPCDMVKLIDALKEE